ncbi:MAG: hypothetical protein COA88_13420, partial [Kordia sp.]
MGKNYFIIFTWILLGFYTNKVFSQAVYIEGVTASQLAAQLSVNGGFTISNAALSNPNTNPLQLGTFSNGTGAGLTIDDGIMLTTGEVGYALTNTGGSYSGSSMQPWPLTHSDPDLIAIEPEATLDAVIFEFDFTISGTEPKVFALDYQFASEEYDYYVCSKWNDTFGFFISGGDLTGSSNLATISGNNVAVNFINSGACGGAGDASIYSSDLNNSSLYIDNNPGTSNMIFNGFTTQLRAYTILRPGISYHMKLAIADVKDRVYDSAVFINPIQIFPLPPKSDIDFDGVDDYVSTKAFLGGYTKNTMMAWLKTDTSFSSEGFVCGQPNFNIFVDDNNRLKIHAQTGQLTATYTVEVNSYNYNTLVGYVQIKINGVVQQFDIGGSTTSQIRPVVGENTIAETFEAAPGDTILIEYIRNGANSTNMDETYFTLYDEDDSAIKTQAPFTLTGDTSNSYSAICTACAPIVVLETPDVSAPILVNDQWYHATARFNGTNGVLTLRVNGVKVWEGTGLGVEFSTKDDANDFSVGRDSKDANDYFKGSIDEVKVYSKALSAKEIKEQVYQEVENSGGLVSGSVIPKPINYGSLSWSDLILYYGMNSIFDVTLIDNSSAPKNGRVFNITSVLDQTAPLPYVANASGDWTTTATWEYGNV